MEYQKITKKQQSRLHHIWNQNFNLDMLPGNKAHYCPANDYHAIDDGMPEFNQCKCDGIKKLK